MNIFSAKLTKIFFCFVVVKAPDKSNNKSKDENSPAPESNHVSKPDSLPVTAASNTSSVGKYKLRPCQLPFLLSGLIQPAAYFAFICF